VADSRQDSNETRAAKAAAAKAAATARGRAHRDAAANSRTGRHFGGFMDFVREQGVVGLAVGLVLGIQVKAVVDQIVASFINPLLGLILPGKGALGQKTFSLTWSNKTDDFAYGAFINVLISFLVITALVYLIVKVLKLDKLDKKKD
jgi:large conductance mechanosensitive channel protein